jgi:hypothetical protein
VGSLFQASDGRVQGRKVAAVVCFLVGVGLLIQGAWQPPTVPWESRIAPAVVALGFSLLLWGLLTIQNVFQLVKLLKEEKP